jgi:hypothetical protein
VSNKKSAESSFGSKLLVTVIVATVVGIMLIGAAADTMGWYWFYQLISLIH